MLNVRYLSLVVLSLQTSVLVLLLRYSRTTNGRPYLISVAVLSSELLKIVLSSLMVLYENGGFGGFLKNKAYQDIFDLSEAIKLSLPAALYVLQNNLLFLALTNLDAATYQITYQLKILTTAVFAWLMLEKKLTRIHWFSLVLLMAGVSLVQVDEVVSAIGHQSSSNSSVNLSSNSSLLSSASSSTSSQSFASWLMGIIAVLISCILSGFSGVYFERILKKGKQLSLGVRNLQLGFFSVIFCLFSLFGDHRIIIEKGFLQGFTVITWIVILIQSVGGLVVSLTMKYADNILKGFATSISIVMSTVASWAILGDRLPSVQFILGATIVMGATFLYGVTPIPQSQPVIMKISKKSL